MYGKGFAKITKLKGFNLMLSKKITSLFIQTWILL
jgi:hypothetical protein